MANRKVRDPHRFSVHFGISGATLIQRGAFDPILNADTPLFIDPLILASSRHPEMQAAHADWDQHFTKIIKLLGVSKGTSDIPWRSAELLFISKEFKGTCLGYGSGTIAGSGIGTELRDRLMRTAHEIVRLGISDPTLFPLLALLEAKLGPDRISDLTTRVIGKRLAEFTARVLAGVGVQSKPFNMSGSMYLLPENPFVRDGGKPLPVVLVPADVLRDLPIASSWEDVEDVAAKNDALRARVSAAIGEIWRTHTLKEKERNREIFLESRERFELLLAMAKAVPKQPYDIKVDPDGWTRWLELGKATAQSYPLQLSLRQHTVGEVVSAVEKIVEHYKYLIEHQGLWKSLYGSDGQPLHEHYAQRLFFAMAIGYCEQNDLAIAPESNAGGGPVDFVLSRGFHAKVVVELKLSGNRQLRHGYVTQLEQYKRGERTEEAFYVILDFGTGRRQIDGVLRRETNALNQGEKHSRVVVVDCRPKKSASKA